MSDPVTLDDIRGRKPAEETFAAFGKQCLAVELSPAEHDDLQNFINEYKAQRGEAELNKRVTLFWVSRCLRNSDRSRVIPDDAIDSLLSDTSGREFRKVFKVVARLNGLTDDTDEPAKNP